MAAFIAWVDQNWFTFIQSIGIIGSLWLSAAALRRDTQAKRISDLLSLSGQHRELWSDVHRRTELSRILQTEVDLVGEPPTLVEEEFLNLVIVHFHTSWLMVKEGAVLSRSALAVDAGSFFALPLPHVVWERTKAFRDAEFVQFIENNIRGAAQKRVAALCY